MTVNVKITAKRRRGNEICWTCENISLPLILSEERVASHDPSLNEDEARSSESRGSHVCFNSQELAVVVFCALPCRLATHSLPQTISWIDFTSYCWPSRPAGSQATIVLFLWRRCSGASVSFLSPGFWCENIITKGLFLLLHIYSWQENW